MTFEPVLKIPKTMAPLQIIVIGLRRPRSIKMASRISRSNKPCAMPIQRNKFITLDSENYAKTSN